MALKLIREFVDQQSLSVLQEANENGEKSYKIHGPFLKANMENRNGRIYPKEILEREVDNYVNQKVKTKMAVGELDHPEGPSINLDRVSHLVESLEMVNDDGMGCARILDTPMGRIAQTLLKGGVQLGVSTRGIGTLNGKHVNDDYKLLAIDIVADPSAPNAYVESVFESKEYIANGEEYVEKAIEKLQRKLDKQGSKQLKEAIYDFLYDIRKSLK